MKANHYNAISVKQNNETNNLEYELRIDSMKSHLIAIKYVVEHPSEKRIDFYEYPWNEI